MKIYKAFRFKLRPNGTQERQMQSFSGCCRYVFNRALSEQHKRRECNEKLLGYAALCRKLAEWKREADTAWLAEAPAQSLQQSLKDLCRAYTNFFDGQARPPRFRCKGKRDSFRYPEPKQFKLDQENSRIFLPKLGWIRYRNSRAVEGSLKNATVNRHRGAWYVSIQTEVDIEKPQHAGGIVGIDVGIVCFARLSNGEFYVSLNPFKRHQERLRKANQSLDRKVRFSNNWKKQKVRIERIHAQIADARRDHLHKASTKISKNHAILCVEDLEVSAMSRSAKGTTKSPGTNVKVKAAFNRAIQDQGWREFRRQLGYKSQWNGGRLVAVPAANTSRTCPACGHVAKANRPNRDLFRCVVCGNEGDADWIAAINIRRVGQTQIACEVSGASRQQQEPTEALALPRAA